MASRENILKSLVLFFLFASVLAPLFFSDLYFPPFTFFKSILFRIFVEGAFIFWIPLILFFPQNRPRFGLIAWVLTFLLGAGYLSALFGVSFRTSFWSDFERVMGLFTYTHFLLFFLMLISVLRTEKLWRTIFITSLGASALISIYGIWQKFFLLNVGRAESTFGNAAFLASYLLSNLFIALFLLARHNRKDFLGIFYASSLLVNAFGILTTGTRGAFLGLFAGGVVFFLIFLAVARGKPFWLLSPRQSRLLLASLFLLILAGGMIFIVFRSNFTGSSFEPLRRVASISLSDRTVEGRLISWQVALEGIKERPLLGWGPENFLILFNKHYDPRLFTQEAWFDRSHNIILDVASNLGILGLALFFALLGAVFYKIWNDRKKWSAVDKAVLTSFGVAYFINAQFVFDNVGTLIPLVLILAYVSFEESIGKKGIYAPKSSIAFYGSGVIAFILMLIPFWYGNMLAAAENSSSKTILNEIRSQVGNPKLLDKFEKNFSGGTFGDPEPRRLFADFVFEVEKAGLELSDNYRRSMLELARRLIEKNRELEPNNARWVVYEANVLNLMSRFGREFSKQAEELSMSSLHLSPRRQQMYFDLAQAQFDLGKIDEAFKTVERAISLEPSFPIAHRHLASYAILAGQKDVAEREIVWLEDNYWSLASEKAVPNWSTPEEDLAYIANVFVRVNDYRRAALFFERFADKSASRAEAGEITKKDAADAYARLAALWALAKDYDRSYQTALKVLEFDNSDARKTEAKNFLKTIGRDLP